MAKNRKFGAFLLSAVFLMAFSTATRAQSYYEEVPRTFYGGLLAGTNFTQVDGDNYAGYHKVGLNVGGIVYTRFADKFAGSLEILFSQRGSRAHQEQRSNHRLFIIQKYNIDLNYAEVPIMFNYFDKKKAHAGAGFSYSQLISSKETVLTTDPTVNALDFEKEYPFKKYDVNFILGGGLRLYKGLFLNLRFQYSLVPVRKDIHPELGRAEQYNNSYVLRLMYLFGTEEPKY
ncbi:porin family protein [Polluticoccus soli]|uniref:porin family protein n=1 Tax=Polluticoccus soli TaxID=3034150 RepID=UPI0023E0B3FE|nr:porin family protein [Flavipsychrobacter sp. JY13-12]